MDRPTPAWAGIEAETREIAPDRGWRCFEPTGRYRLFDAAGNVSPWFDKAAKNNVLAELGWVTA